MKWSLLGCAAMVSVFALSGCGGSVKPAPITACALNSDCATGLVCTFGLCHSACVKDSDCLGAGELCVKTNTPGDGGDINVCQMPAEAMCYYNSDCMAPLVCGRDERCRNQCETNVDCVMGEVCATSGVCAVQSELTSSGDVKLVTTGRDGGYDRFATGTAGESGSGGATGTGGSGAATGSGGSAGASGHTGAGGGAGTTACTAPQTAFANVAQGAANPNFTNAVAAANGDTLFIFSSYRGPVPVADGGVDAGTTTDNVIYVQEFDPASGIARGGTSPLYDIGIAGDLFAVQDVSIAPTGQIALLYTLRQSGNSYSDTLYAAFWTAGTAGDGGLAKLQLARQPVLLEAVANADPHVTWSASSAQFVVSWKYATTNWYTHVRRFTPSGSGTGVDSSMVPTETGVVNAPPYYDSAVGTSGQLVAVGTRNTGNGYATLTILDTDGQQVGRFLDLAPANITYVSVGGTTSGFLGLSTDGAAARGAYVPITGSTSVIGDGGVPDAGVASLFKTFSYSSNGTYSKMANDDTGGQGGVGISVLESNGASFLYVTADGSKQLKIGTVLTSNGGTWTDLTNYRGAFAVSLYDGTKHSAQAVVSSCP